MLLEFLRADVQFSVLRLHCPEVDSGKLSIHCSADLETIETFLNSAQSLRSSRSERGNPLWEEDPNVIDLSVPRRAQDLHKAWKRHQDAVYWVDINFALKKEFTFCQT